MIIPKVIKLAMNVFEQKMTEFDEKTDDRKLTSSLAMEFSDALKDALSEAGRTAFQKFIERYDVDDPTIDVYDRKLRWKTPSSKKFLTPFGILSITRSLYQADSGGKTYSPLDDFWGMKDEFATEDVREAVAFSVAHMTPGETEQLLKKCAWFHPSETAIKNIVNKIGDFAEKHEDAILPKIHETETIPENTDVLVCSMDGVNVLLREPGASPGRPAERPGLKDSSSPNTSYKNAMVGVVSCYARPADPKEERPQRLQSTLFCPNAPRTGGCIQTAI